MHEPTEPRVRSFLRTLREALSDRHDTDPPARELARWLTARKERELPGLTPADDEFLTTAIRRGTGT